MNSELLDEIDGLYLTWLYAQVGSVVEKNPSRTYWKVLTQLHTKEFVWITPNDDNRAEDGRNLRIDFINFEAIDEVEHFWMEKPCSMLEMMVGLSQRIAFVDDGDPRDWFWHLMANLGLDRYNDRALVPDVEIDKILDEVIWRTYRRNGRGGLFPLRNAHEDQTRVEIWKQMHQYLLEMD